ncbi:ribonuclease HI family protein [Candidatus Parcubacteria bacterium]|nr:ribonuclease HI family protein [Candidatus Parcubacteria bacterium]
MRKITIYTDGGARGNPGPAGIGAVIQGDGLNKSYGEYIGEATNNEAEYQALIFALKKTKSLLGKLSAKQAELECFLDSELIVKQLNHQYKIENERMQVFFLQVWNLMLDFSKVVFKHIPREQNKEADAMVNQAIDKATGAGGLF